MPELDLPSRPCRAASCTAQVVWATTGGNKPIPVDPEPVPGGNIELSTESGRVRATVVSPNPTVVRYVSHFTTCPDATAQRRSRGSAR